MGEEQQEEELGRSSRRRRSGSKREGLAAEEETLGRSKCSLPQDVLLQHAITENLITWIPAHHLR